MEFDSIVEKVLEEYRDAEEKIYSFHENLNALVDEREATESDEPLTAEEVLDAAQEAGFEEAYAQQISDSYASSFNEDPVSPETFWDKNLLEKNAALKEVEKKPDIILLDVNMPDIDGFTVCERIRDYVSCPIIFLTARIEDSDKIKGFSIGADDYVIKPFSVDELEARIAAHLRREKRHNISSKVQFDEDMVIDYSSRIVFYHNKDMAFTKKEFDIISFLSQNKGIVFDRETIYEKVWGLDGIGDNTVVTEHIRRIRAKFLSLGDRPYIETVWGCGYRWKN